MFVGLKGWEESSIRTRHTNDLMLELAEEVQVMQ